MVEEKTRTATRSDERVKHPPLFRVILLNDDYTTMEFVVFVLQTVFHLSGEQATAIMLAVHKNGSGVAGIYTKEVAETKVAIVTHLARQSEHPLKCVVEPAE
jgi:ATP-dependent Clp protease adaptor protein ClpS